MRKIGLIVNPVAGMGGSVGLKGTDGEMHARALELGALPVSPGRTHEFLDTSTRHAEITWLAAPGVMGSDYLRDARLPYETVGSLAANPAPRDTVRIAKQMLDAGAELLVFAGGDGTARDMADAVDLTAPVIGIPAGVKVYSSVFAYSPRAAAALLDAFVDGADVAEEEVLDIDEEAFRAGRVDARHYGFLLVPEVDRLLQAGKESSGTTGSAVEMKRDLAEAVIDTLEPGVLYLLGSGTTIRTIAEVLGVDKTLLGIDAVIDGQLVGRDLNERAILALLDQYAKAAIVVTPLGGNGFIFGRGNKQFTPTVLRRVGTDNIIVVASRDKLLKLGELHVDTADVELDTALAGYIDVIVGRGHSKMMRIL